MGIFAYIIGTLGVFNKVVVKHSCSEFLGGIHGL